MSDAIIIFIKNPIPGKTKTRLARTLGNTKALEIYHSLCKITRRQVEKLDIDRLLFYSDEVTNNDEWDTAKYQKNIQSGVELGARMENAFTHVFTSAGKACIIGSDCPEISSQIINEAFERLNHFDFVIGPSTDGGYYLLGMRELNTSVFHGIEWSTSSVLVQTIAEIKKLNKTFFLLEELTDIDEEKDWQLFKDIIAAQNG